ncbi:MAG: hypothetical protein ACXAC6_09775 [Candidatus Hodarchaeales archaeon]|jgi:hypothetical protein
MLDIFFASIVIFLGILDILFGGGLFGLLVFGLLLASMREGYGLKRRVRENQVKKVVRNSRKIDPF